ncbi:MAG: hypothetical protein IKK87_06000 [Bacteroidaceae bacterium]|nr:hypothetical protein [Bacteroidaceae bacterium]
MVTTEVSTEIFRNLGILAENEEMLPRVAKYLRRLVKEQQQADATLMSKEEFFGKLDKAEEEYRQGKYTTLLPGESVADMLKRCGYDV